MDLGRPVTIQDIDLIKKGREFEREHIITSLRKKALSIMKRNPNHALQIGFVIEAIKDLPEAWESL
jgi:hypothetical protein